MIRYISDLHFGHKNILSFSKGSIISWQKSGVYNGDWGKLDSMESVKDWDDTIISSWNSVVKVDDVTYIIGDVSLAGVEYAIECLKKLNGDKILICGNHDKKFLRNPEFRKCFTHICETFEESIIPKTSLEKWNHNDDYLYLDEGIYNNDLPISFCHYPIFSFNKNCYGAILLYGHIHSSFEENYFLEKAIDNYVKYKGFPMNMFNVGCMMPYMNYTPRTIEEIIKGKIDFYKKCKM